MKRKSKKFAVNFGLIKRNLVSWDDSKKKEYLEMWHFHVDKLHHKVEELLAKKKVSMDVLPTLESVALKLKTLNSSTA